MHNKRSSNHVTFPWMCWNQCDGWTQTKYVDSVSCQLNPIHLWLWKGAFHLNELKAPYDISLLAKQSVAPHSRIDTFQSKEAKRLVISSQYNIRLLGCIHICTLVHLVKLYIISNHPPFSVLSVHMC